jgi:NAD(P)H-hydrate repair Nnr-like enzyme with NAD(P)H-hydrate dehydratase domain
MRFFYLEDDRPERYGAAIKQNGAIVLPMGADTGAVTRDGRAASNSNAPLQLVTGDSGDVPAGFARALAPIANEGRQ